MYRNHLTLCRGHMMYMIHLTLCGVYTGQVTIIPCLAVLTCTGPFVVLCSSPRVGNMRVERREGNRSGVKIVCVITLTTLITLITLIT